LPSPILSEALDWTCKPYGLTRLGYKTASTSKFWPNWDYHIKPGWGSITNNKYYICTLKKAIFKDIDVFLKHNSLCPPKEI
jgi:hypothetical protein